MSIKDQASRPNQAPASAAATAENHRSRSAAPLYRRLGGNTALAGTRARGACLSADARRDFSEVRKKQAAPTPPGADLQERRGRRGREGLKSLRPTDWLAGRWRCRLAGGRQRFANRRHGWGHAPVRAYRATVSAGQKSRRP